MIQFGFQPKNRIYNIYIYKLYMAKSWLYYHTSARSHVADSPGLGRFSDEKH